jgi:hypothetical protein
VLSDAGMSKEYLPNVSVTVRYVVWPTETSTPESGLAPLALSTTVPLIGKEYNELKAQKRKIMNKGDTLIKRKRIPTLLEKV